MTAVGLEKLIGRRVLATLDCEPASPKDVQSFDATDESPDSVSGVIVAVAILNFDSCDVVGVYIEAADGQVHLRSLSRVKFAPLPKIDPANDPRKHPARYGYGPG